MHSNFEYLIKPDNTVGTGRLERVEIRNKSKFIKRIVISGRRKVQLALRYLSGTKTLGVKKRLWAQDRATSSPPSSVPWASHRICATWGVKNKYSERPGTVLPEHFQATLSSRQYYYSHFFFRQENKTADSVKPKQQLVYDRALIPAALSRKIGLRHNSVHGRGKPVPGKHCGRRDQAKRRPAGAWRTVQEESAGTTRARDTGW